MGILNYLHKEIDDSNKMLDTPVITLFIILINNYLVLF